MSWGLAQAVNRASKTKCYLQWREHKPKQDAVVSVMQDLHNYQLFLLLSIIKAGISTIFTTSNALPASTGDNTLTVDNYTIQARALPGSSRRINNTDSCRNDFAINFEIPLVSQGITSKIIQSFVVAFAASTVSVAVDERGGVQGAWENVRAFMALPFVQTKLPPPSFP